VGQHNFVEGQFREIFRGGPIKNQPACFDQKIILFGENQTKIKVKPISAFIKGTKR